MLSAVEGLQVASPGLRDVVLPVGIAILALLFSDSGAGATYFLQRGLPLTGDPVGLAVLLAGASQLYLGALSLVPIPPLDGGRIVSAVSPWIWTAGAVMGCSR